MTEQRNEFFQTLYGGIEEPFRIELRAVSQKEGLKDRIFTNGLDCDAINRFAEVNQKQGREVYFGVATRKSNKDGTKRNCSYLPAFWVDVDFKDIGEDRFLKLLTEFPLKPTIIVRTGGGIHLYFLFKEAAEANVTLEKYLRGLARYFKGDMGATDLSRILRIPQTSNLKYEPPRQVQIAEMNGVRYNPMDFDLVVSPEDEETPCRRNAPEWEKDLIEGVPPGERNVDATKLAGRYMQMGLHPGEVLNMLMGWNLRNNDPLDKTELQNIVASVFKYHPQEQIQSEFIVRCLKQNQDGDAFLFRELNKTRFCYDHAEGRYYEFDGNYWREDRKDNATAAIQGLIEVYENEAKRQFDLQTAATREGKKDAAGQHGHLANGLLGRIKSLQAPQRKRDVLHLAACGEGSLGITGDEWDRLPWTLACANGIVDLRTGELRKGRSSDYIKTFAPTQWKDLREIAPTFENFVSEIFDRNVELAEFVQRLFGYALTRSAVEHIFPIFYGNGRNGKGTLLQAMSYALGPYVGPIPAEMLLKQRFARSAADPTADIMHLRAKSLVWASETGSGRSLNAGKLKWLVGGDQLVGRPPHGKSMITFMPTHTLILLTNNKPKAPSGDYALWQRILLVPFTLSFVDRPKAKNERQRDPRLTEKLKKEASGILAWLVRGCLEYQQYGLDTPDIVMAATEQYRQEEDQIQNFLNDTCVIEEGATVRADPLFEAYQKWAEDNKVRKSEVLGQRNFGKEIGERFERDRDNQGHLYKGLKLGSS